METDASVLNDYKWRWPWLLFRVVQWKCNGDLVMVSREKRIVGIAFRINVITAHLIDGGHLNVWMGNVTLTTACMKTVLCEQSGQACRLPKLVLPIFTSNVTLIIPHAMSIAL